MTRRVALLGLAALAFIAAGAAAFLTIQQRTNDLRTAAALEPAAGVEITLPDESRLHIIENHRHGSGKACKSEFPVGWKDEKIFQTLKTLAANDNIPWQQEDNGYYVGEQDIDGLKVRVVLNREENIIVTGYPVNVERNPCPLRGRQPDPANDNAVKPE